MVRRIGDLKQRRLQRKSIHICIT